MIFDFPMATENSMQIWPKIYIFDLIPLFLFQSSSSKKDVHIS